MGQLVFQAALGGQVNLVGPNTASTFNLNVPAASDTLVGRATTDTLTNKTLTSPTLTTPVLGTPSSGTLTNCTGLPNAGLVNSSVTIGGTAIALGASSSTITNDLTISGLTVGKGNASVATNTAMGVSALSSVTTGDTNTATGYQALTTNTSGTSNTAYGVQALRFNTTGGSNAAFGRGSLNGNTTGSYNTSLGDSALTSNTTASNNTAVGYQALYNQSAGAGPNTAIGYLSGLNVTTGGGNVFLGQSAGNGSTTTGSFNVLIGNSTNANAGADNYEIVIGATGTTGKGSSTGFINPQGGGVYQGNNSATWSITSDRRLKKNIVDNNTGLEKITAIQVRNFEYRLPEEVDVELKPTDAIIKEGVQLGAIAQELQQVLPDCVKTESSGVMSVNTDNLTWYLVNAVKELSARIKQLEGN
jgi:hypothetical protein